MVIGKRLHLPTLDLPTLSVWISPSVQMSKTLPIMPTQQFANLDGFRGLTGFARPDLRTKFKSIYGYGARRTSKLRLLTEDIAEVLHG